ncbi:MAG: hypothetical protein EOP87_07775 [Verrucomicrobiaceae bacterium]|nr:MAG: hypothetical protein EOP87_07775 [Verrucomicrobiaceae bacterium]
MVMKPDYDPQRLDGILQQLFDERLPDDDAAELNALLSRSRQARDHYRKSLRVHAALIRHRQVENVIPLHKSRRAAPLLAVAACVLLGFSVFMMRGREPVARLTGTSAAVWSGDTTLGMNHPLDLVSGFVEVGYRSGVRVILEGPCRFEITSETSMRVTHGRATVKVPKHLDGFHLDTPSGRITDLGTEFGVAVGSGVEGPVVLTEVFDGEIEIPAEDTPRKRLLSGESLAIVRETGGTRLVSTLGEYRVDLRDSARQLPAKSASASAEGNLALGKPVSSPAHYARNHGSVFPPSTLTDGRLNDSGSPGDWAYWLAPNHDHGEFTVDLLSPNKIGKVGLQNTRNRSHDDRGMHGFRLLVSEDGVEFREILQGELARIEGPVRPGVDFPFESFTFEPVVARYVKVIGTSHYRERGGPEDDDHQGGGLNEIRIFAP